MWEASAKDDQPWAWKKILKIRNSLRPHISCQVGDGRQVSSLFYDKWLLGKPLCDYMLNDTKIWGRNLKARAWWNSESGWAVPNSFKRKYPMLADEIQRQQLREVEDRYIWQPNNSGMFSVASFYELLRHRKPKVDWYRLIWKSKIPPKVSFICWLLMHKMLKTRQFLSARGVNISTECVFCICTNETCEHLFWQCEYSNKVWKELLESSGIHRNPQEWSRELSWLKQYCKGRNRAANRVRTLFVCTVYFLWQGRMRSTESACRKRALSDNYQNNPQLLIIGCTTMKS